MSHHRAGLIPARGILDMQFIVLRGQTQSVPALLQHMMAFEPIGALVVNW